MYSSSSCPFLIFIFYVSVLYLVFGVWQSNKLVFIYLNKTLNTKH